jgi:exosortase
MDLGFRRRAVCFTVLCAVFCLFFLESLKNLTVFALSHDYGSHILLVVPVSISIIFLRRDRVFSKFGSGFLPSTAIFLIAAALNVIAFSLRSHGANNCLSLKILAFLLFCTSAFTLCYGPHALRMAAFPFLFLLFLIPVPDFVVEKIISLLQIGSAQVALWLFNLSSVPVMREGLVFHIPTLDLEIAKECSGIRSSIVLLITTVLLSEFFLRSFAAKSVVVLCVFPMVIVKNAVRIVVISLLTVYLNRGFLHGWLHQSGGIVFYVLGLLMLMGILKCLKKWETRTTPASEQCQDNSQGRLTSTR